jgi:thiamine biosynthesis lipoprotein
MNRRRFLLVSAAALAAGRARAEVTTWQAPAFGGTVRVDLRGPRPLAQGVASGIAATIAEIDRAASLFRPESALTRLNAAGRLDDPPRALLDLLAHANRVHAATGGVFDPTVQPVWRALAEGRDPAAAREAIGWGRVRRGPTVRLAPGQALTLNGVAQGYAADRVRALLLAAGYGHALVDMGEFAALSGPFSLGVEDPAAGIVAIRQLTGGAIATSSPGAMLVGGAPHILGPRGEAPCWSTISVEADSAALADSLSTAFCLMDQSAIVAVRAHLPQVSRVTAVATAGNVLTF